MRLALDIASAFCLLSGAFLALIAAIGIARFNNLFSRMHAATKPQVLGLLLILLGIGLRMEAWSDLGLLVLVAVFQLLTAPVAAHMLGRAVYRTGSVDHDLTPNRSVPAAMRRRASEAPSGAKSASCSTESGHRSCDAGWSSSTIFTV